MSTPQRPLRIAVTATRVPPDLGGVENHVWEVARRLPEHGFEVTVIATGRERGLPARVDGAGVTIRRTRALRWPPDAYLAPGVVRLLAGLRYDLLHVQGYQSFVAPLAMTTALVRRRPYVVTFHGGGHSSRLRTAGRPVQLAVLRPLLRRAQRLVATAQFEIDHYGRALGIGPDRFAYIPNGADLPAPVVAPQEREAGLVVSIGRLERYKGHHRVIEAMPDVLRARPDARLWIVGSGSYEPELHALARRLGVERRVEIRAVPPDERARFASEVGRARVAVFMSEFETHPLAAIEAAGLGLPLLLADSSGLGELVRAGVGRGVPLDASAPQLARAIADDLENGAAPPPGLELPTWDACVADLARLYREVLGESGGAR
jgi:glycosyltransferase involved in cell wall biosynthesis